MSCADSVTLTCCLLTRLCYQHSCCQYSLSLLSSRFTHTFAIFFNLCWELQCSSSQPNSSTCHQHMNFALDKCASDSSTVLGDKTHFLGKESSLLRSLLMLRVPGTLSGLSLPVCEIWLGLRAGFCLRHLERMVQIWGQTKDSPVFISAFGGLIDVNY